jgi:hypothetical protein
VGGRFKAGNVRGTVITAPQHLPKGDVRHDQLIRALRRAGPERVRRLGRRHMEPRERRPRPRRVIDRQDEAALDPRQLVGELAEIGSAEHVLAVIGLAAPVGRIEVEQHASAIIAADGAGPSFSRCRI